MLAIIPLYRGGIWMQERNSTCLRSATKWQSWDRDSGSRVYPPFRWETLSSQYSERLPVSERNCQFPVFSFSEMSAHPSFPHSLPHFSAHTNTVHFLDTHTSYNTVLGLSLLTFSPCGHIYVCLWVWNLIGPENTRRQNQTQPCSRHSIMQSIISKRILPGKTWQTK